MLVRGLAAIRPDAELRNLGPRSPPGFVTADRENASEDLSANLADLVIGPPCSNRSLTFAVVFPSRGVGALKMRNPTGPRQVGLGMDASG